MDAPGYSSQVSKLLFQFSHFEHFVASVCWSFSSCFLLSRLCLFKFFDWVFLPSFYGEVKGIIDLCVFLLRNLLGCFSFRLIENWSFRNFINRVGMLHDASGYFRMLWNPLETFFDPSELYSKHLPELLQMILRSSAWNIFRRFVCSSGASNKVLRKLVYLLIFLF